MNLLQISNDSLTSLVITLGSLLFTLLLFFVYFPKQKLNFMRCKLYRLMLYTVLIILLTEVVSIFWSIYGTGGDVYKIFYYITWCSVLIWFILFYCHSICYFGDINSKNYRTFFKENKKVHYLLLFVLIAIIGYILLPDSKATVDTSTTYIHGASEYYILAVLVLICIWILLEAYVFIKNVPKRRKVSLILIDFVLVAVLSFQLLFPNICIYPLITSLQVFFIYFTIENPDIYLTGEMDLIKQDIEKSNRAKTDFLNNMSHEIRTPMNAIVGFNDMLLNSPDFNPERAKNDIQSIAVAGNNLLDIINNILDISKIESGKETLEERDYELGNVINELSNIIKTRINSDQVKMIVELGEGTPSKLNGDSTKVYQILLNILSNSAKYTEVGKIKLTIDPEYIDDEFVVLHFKIADTGYGIKKEDFNKMFEKFSRLDKAVSNEIEGTGLGLVITKKYVDLMDGKIWFESEYEVGTTFYVDIPQKVIDKSPIINIDKEETKSINNEYIDCSKFNALVVDDNKLNIKVAERILKKYKFNVDHVDNGRDCIFKVKSGNSYDIIFMDIMMPEMDGVETLHIIKKLEGYTIPPIIALTANAIAGVKEKYLSEGFDAYLSKPINISELDKVIHKYLDTMLLSSISPNRVNPVTLGLNDSLDDVDSTVMAKAMTSNMAISKNISEPINKTSDDKHINIPSSDGKHINMPSPDVKHINMPPQNNTERQTLDELVNEEPKNVIDDNASTDNITSEESSPIQEIKNDTNSEDDNASNIDKEKSNSSVEKQEKTETKEFIEESKDNKHINKNEISFERISNESGGYKEKLSKEDINTTNELIDDIVDKVEPIINMVPSVNLKNDIDITNGSNGVEIELVKLSIKVEPDSNDKTIEKDRKD